MQDYRNLRVWQKAHNLTLATYAISAYLQKPEAWPVRDQLFRAQLGSGFPEVSMALLGFL
jgi:hypothetical protein